MTFELQWCNYQDADDAYGVYSGFFANVRHVMMTHFQLELSEPVDF